MATNASKTVPPAIEFSSMLNQLEGLKKQFPATRRSARANTEAGEVSA
jgi:hypothetical protein